MTTWETRLAKSRVFLVINTKKGDVAISVDQIVSIEEIDDGVIIELPNRTTAFSGMSFREVMELISPSGTAKLYEDREEKK